MSKRYWRGLPELNNSPEFQEKHQNEFAEPLPLNENENTNEISRKDFLKWMGFSTAAVALASCEAPVMKSIPYVVKPEEITPGVPTYYASSYYDGHNYASILVKTREGRPIKVDGNERNRLTGGTGTHVRTQASVLSLYDNARLRGPYIKGYIATWNNLDAAVSEALSKAKTVYLISSTIISPSTQQIIRKFSSKVNGFKHIQYDAVSYQSIRKAHKEVFGEPVIPSYDFSKAIVVAGISCDFLGTWLMPDVFAAQYAKNRKVKKEKPVMSRHFHFEANMSLTGANADYRYMCKPSDFGKIAVELYNTIASATGNATVGDSGLAKELKDAVAKVSKELLENKGKSLVVCGINDPNIQGLVCGINKMLDNYGKTLDITEPYLIKQGSEEEFEIAVKDMAEGKVDVVMFYNANPVYTSPASFKFTDALKKVPTKISFSRYMDETAQLCDFVCPDHHPLESWGDYQPKLGHLSLQQPTISPVFALPRHEGTRQFQDSLLKWSGEKTDYYSYLKAYWNKRFFPLQSRYSDFFNFWTNALAEGYLYFNFKKAPASVINEEVQLQTDSAGNYILNAVPGQLDLTKEGTADTTSLKTTVTVNKYDNKTKQEEPPTLPNPDYPSYAKNAVSYKTGKFEIQVYEKVSMGDGSMPNNPWLMELPDPITKVTWDNYITMCPEDVKELGFNQMLRQDIIGSIAEVTVDGVSFEVPVLPQPGQTKGTIGIALGYGRKAESMKVSNGIGANAYPILKMLNGCLSSISVADIKNPNKDHKFACTQIQHTIMGREEYILRETSLNEYKTKEPRYYNPPAELTVHGGGKKHVSEIDLWDPHPRPNHRWGLVIDLSACTGCSACVIACSAENNVAVVGKDEVSRTRDMFWLRIDRYYTSDTDKNKKDEKGLLASRKMYLDMENPSLNPRVTFQPIMCQHCNHAPCETVCPVLATSHSTEGLNMMTYNRCIGTRYCANNCPFKVRRFNWFNYSTYEKFTDVNPAQSDLGRMVLNPDVVVRSRGVMEKCSMCQQRIQAGKLEAKKNGTPVPDGSIKMACEVACPTNAIKFGDLNDENSEVNKWAKDDKNYYLLEELGIRPTVSYLVKIRNTDERITFYNEEDKGHFLSDDHKKTETEQKHS
ncbi:MAG: TAT-variant-translocated molybdopterin oxidoreductase [Bacteroidia bacterium]|nr:TAT-variant-translocated molybdopterin oxidoreductase [Bacteroidia bacterium]